MHRLCALIFLFFAPAAFALPSQVETQVMSFSTSGVPAADIQNTSQRVSGIATTMTYHSQSFWRDRVTLSQSVTEMKNDYSTIMLTDVDGRQSPLSDKFNADETTEETTVELKIKAHTVSATYGTMLTDQSPFRYQGASLNYNYAFFSGASVAGISYNWYQQDQPLTYYTDPRDFQYVSRPEMLTAQRIELWFEQAMSERWKSQLRLIEGQRFEDRPRHMGLEWRNAIALTSRLYGRIDTGSILEDRTQPLKDERGYYSLYWTEFQLTYEVVYDLLISASAGTIVEREDVVWNGTENQVGTDTYGLKANYKGRSWSATLGALISTSNTSFRSHMIQGGLTWDI